MCSNTAIRRTLAIVALAALAGACAQRPEVIKLYENPAAGRTQYDRLFIVGVTGDADQRITLEQLIVDRLRSRGVSAVASYGVLGSGDSVLQETLDKAVADSGADALLMSHIASIDTAIEREEGREEIVSTCRGGDPVDYFLYDHRVIKVPDSVRQALTVVVVTNLLDAASGERIWTIQSTCFRKATLEEGLAEEAEAIARQLGIDGLVRTAP